MFGLKNAPVKVTPLADMGCGTVRHGNPMQHKCIHTSTSGTVARQSLNGYPASSCHVTIGLFAVHARPACLRSFDILWPKQSSGLGAVFCREIVIGIGSSTYPQLVPVVRCLLFRREWNVYPKRHWKCFINHVDNLQLVINNLYQTYRYYEKSWILVEA